MNGNVGVEIIMILGLILVNSLFALAEFAIVSARKSRLERYAEEGRRNAQVALELARNPGDFLSTVQIGITLVGILAGAFGGALLSTSLAGLLLRLGVSPAYANSIALGVVVAAITLLSLVFGELVPKRLALSHPEKYALSLAGLMRSLSRLARPLVKLLSWMTDGILRLFGADVAADATPSEDEIRVLLGQATRAGVFLTAEQDMIEGVFRLADRRVGVLITPRTDIEWLDLEDPPEAVLRQVVESSRSHFPVAHGSLDDIRGIASAHVLLSAALQTGEFSLEAHLNPPVFVPDSIAALQALELLRSPDVPFLLVIDEFGGLEGLVSLNDLVQSIVGDLPEPGELGDQEIVEREDGSLLIDGMLPVDELVERFRLPALPDSDLGLYQTLGGFVMNSLGRIPSPGDLFEWNGLRFEVVDMDGRRVDKVLVLRIPQTDTEQELKGS